MAQRDATGSGSQDPQLLDPTSRSFDVKEYIRHVYANATHVDMEGSLVDAVRREADNAGEELKELIRDSMGTFIGCKEAMDVMYANDKSLFTGEALDPIADGFQSALEEGKALITPTLELFEELRATRMMKETLAKLMAVWRVPGLIYEYCGVRVPSRRSDMVWWRVSHGINADGRPNKSKNPDGGSENAPSDESGTEGSSHDEDDEDEGESAEDSDKGDTAAAVAQRIARGALEEFADGGPDDYLLEPGEELRFWHGTALARPRDLLTRRRVAEERSNYEAAVLSLRRAMLYLEENYDLERAVVMGIDETAADNEEVGLMGDASQQQQPQQQQQLSEEEQKEQKEKEEKEGAMTLTYRYALALLRASLYLNDQLARELRRAGAADTVLIEDTLSAMMDVSIATVKLRHFCWTARTALHMNENERNALSGLRQHLDTSDFAESEENITTDRTDPNNSNAANEREEGEASGSEAQAITDASFATSVETSGAESTNASSQRRVEHPVEYYVRLTRNQHTRLMETSARRASREAQEWRRKFLPDLNPNADPDAGEDAQRGLDGGTFTAAAAAGGGGGLLGSLADSFSPATGVLLSGGTISEVAAGTIGDRVRVALDTADNAEMQDAGVILEAFRTPEINFGRFTTFRIGEVEMNDVLESSAAQLAMHARSILQQIVDRSDVEVDVAAHAASISTFSSRLFEACVEHMELVLASYWGGIATAVHAGIFDFKPDDNTPLGRMLHGPAALNDAKNDDKDNVKKDGKRQNSSMNPSNMTNKDDLRGRGHNFDDPMHDGTGHGVEEMDPKGKLNANAAGDLPPLTFIPVVGRDSGGPTLRQLSVAAVRKGVRAAGDILHALLLTSANRAVLQAFVRAMATYRVRDVGYDDDDDERQINNTNNNTYNGNSTRDGNTERVELHAAITVELLLSQWERAMTLVSDAVLRMKVVVGESCTSSSVATEAQAQEVGELLEELEQLRTSLLRCYTHATGMLAKAYITLLPSLQPPPRSSTRVRARVSRDFVSSVMTNKLLNLISVVVDRTAPFLQRAEEVFGGIDLFAAKAEEREEEEEEDRAAPSNGPRRRTRLLRRRQKEAPPESNTSLATPIANTNTTAHAAQLDPVTAFMAQCNSRMVLEHVVEHEETLLALVANVLLVFIDMLHHRCQVAASSGFVSDEARERTIVECLADALCLPTSVAPLITDELVTPCILNVLAALSAPENRALPARKAERFRVDYLSRVEEHCQLVVDAILGMFLFTPQRQITCEVRTAGFLAPMMDWQRVSSHTAGSVRPYVTDAIVHIARAHETLQLLRQPVLGAAATQRLVAHLASVFITSLTSDGNAFEISPDCSGAFLSHGLLLLEAEARTILGIAAALVEGISRNPKAGGVLPELRAAQEALQGVATSIRNYGGAVCDAIATRRANATSLSPSASAPTASGEGSVMHAKQREARCEAMVAASLERSRYMVQAIITYAEDSTIAAAFKPIGGGATPASIAERLARGKEGYRQKGRPAREKPEGPHTDFAADEQKGVMARKKARRMVVAVPPSPPPQPQQEEAVGESNREAQHASVLRLAAEKDARAGGAPKDVPIPRRTTRKRRTGKDERTADDGDGHARRFKRNLGV